MSMKTVPAIIEMASDGNVGVLAGILKAGGSMEEGKNNKASNKVHFTIPVMLPSRKAYTENPK